MSQGYQIYDQSGVYFFTFQVVDWVDIFSRKVYRDVVVDSMNYCIEKKGLRVVVWVIMTNHVHAILYTEGNNLSDVIRDFKAHTAREILKLIEAQPESRKVWMEHIFRFNARYHSRNEERQFWTHENHAVYCEPTKPEMIISRIHYIHENPVRAGWVEVAEHYLYSSARDYAGAQGLVKVVII